MICPNCGAQIGEDHLLCSVCGYEIQIVPEFDAEINRTIEETISDISAGIAEAQATNVEKKEQSNKKTNFLSGKTGLIIGGIAAVVLLCLVFAGFSLKKPSDEIGMDKIDIALKEGDTKKAIERAEKVYKNNPNDLQNILLLGKMYAEEDRIVDAKSMYHLVIDADPSNVEAYDGLVNLYLEEENYDQIGELISASSDANIRNIFQRFIAEPPVFSVKQGSYDDIVKLHLSANTEGKIFYTLDGSKPDKNSTEYTDCIELGQGIWTVSAIFLNNYSIESDIVTNIFEINLPIPDKVVVTPESGTFNKPTSIAVSMSPDTKVYYTTNGSDPTSNSSVYKNPIPMPLGKSTFKFVAVDSKGNLGEVTTCEYSFKLDSPIDIDYAHDLLFDQLIDLGIVIDRNGTIPSMEGKLIFKCNTAINMSGENYYLFEEYLDNGDGKPQITRTSYVINAGNGIIYKTITDNNGGYMIQPFED